MNVNERLSVFFFVIFPFSALWVLGRCRRVALGCSPHVCPLQIEDVTVNRS